MTLTPIWFTFMYFLTLTYGLSSSNNTQYIFNLNCCDVVYDAALCCPYKNGICCDDKLHCCPENSFCHPDTNLTICVPKSKLGIPLIKNLYSSVPLHLQDLKTTASQSVKVCPSKLLACPKKSTCCPGPYIGYDCCPLSQGVCCEDFQHCCPYNSSCHAKAKQCISNTGVKFPWVRKLKAERTPGTRIKKYNMISKKVTSSNGICPRNTINRCHEDHTCCIINGGNHGCCPIINAVCCNDGTHCCPKGSVCSSNSTCVGKIKNKFGGIPINEELLSTNSSPTNDNIWQKKPFSKSQNVNATIICPGGQYSCPSGTSCCPSTKGTYGCCPFAVSVCCADKWHCCPAGFVCDLEKNVCTRGGLFIPLFSAARGYEVSKVSVLANIECLDHSECPDNTTCCELPSGQYGCCPLEKAVCCSDKIHCCPYRTVCDLKAKGCRPGNGINLQPFEKVGKA